LPQRPRPTAIEISCLQEYLQHSLTTTLVMDSSAKSGQALGNLLRLQEQVFRRANTKPDILDAEDILEREKAACEKHALPRRAK